MDSASALRFAGRQNSKIGTNYNLEYCVGVASDKEVRTDYSSRGKVSYVLLPMISTYM